MIGLLFAIAQDGVMFTVDADSREDAVEMISDAIESGDTSELYSVELIDGVDHDHDLMFPREDYDPACEDEPGIPLYMDDGLGDEIY